MSIIVSNLMERQCLEDLLEIWDAGMHDLQIALYRNDITPDENTVFGDFTEANFAGYARESPLPWSAPLTDVNGRAYTQSAALTYTGTGADQLIYGWYAIGDDDFVRFCERLPGAPITLGLGRPALVFQILLRLRELGG